VGIPDKESGLAGVSMSVLSSIVENLATEVRDRALVKDRGQKEKAELEVMELRASHVAIAAACACWSIIFYVNIQVEQMDCLEYWSKPTRTIKEI
jgi:hypothetical protein